MNTSESRLHFYCC